MIPTRVSAGQGSLRDAGHSVTNELGAKRSLTTRGRISTPAASVVDDDYAGSNAKPGPGAKATRRSNVSPVSAPHILLSTQVWSES